MRPFYVLYKRINVSGLPKQEDRCLVCKPVFSAAKCHSGTAQFSSFHLHYVNAGKPVTKKYKYDPI